MTYSSAVEYLYGLQKHGIKLGLHNIQALLDGLDHPQRRYRVIHIAGTNGKGSTSAMAAAILQAAQYRVGLYTSPHLIEFRERIRVGGQQIPDRCVAELVERIRLLAGSEIPLTFFEFTTAMAFQYFADCHVDVAVVEVGMGGRFDATNVVEPVSCAITTISLDHEEYLGHTIERIALEKAGIVKPGIPVVLGRVPPAAIQLIDEIARQQGAPIYRLGGEFTVAKRSATAFDYEGITTRYENVTSPLLGTHQFDNAACALALLEVGEATKPSVAEKVVREGLASTRWEGRLEIVARNPMVMLDGAHNPAAASVLAEFLAQYRTAYPASRVALILGMMRDKAHRPFFKVLQPYIDELIVTQADIHRAVPAEQLSAELSDLSPSIRTASAPVDALLLARRLMTPADMICVTGSLMLVGDIKAFLRGCTLSTVRG
jgi:dihydrofolate synthase/folylpolyglutamate synthase